MTIQERIHVLNNHNIKNEMVDGRILAIDQSTYCGELYESWVDVTEFSPKQMKEWLGY